MNNCKFKASIIHTDKTVRELYKIQYFCFDKNKVIIRFAVGFALILAAVIFEISFAFKGILLLIGAWLVSTPDFPSQVRAEKNLAARKSSLPVLTYEFFDDFLKLSGEGTCEIDYSKIKILLQDTKYFYLFLSKNSACMIDKSSIENLDGFMTFLQDKTKIKWQIQKSFFAMNLQDFIQIFKN